MMKHLFSVFVLLLLGLSLKGQSSMENEKGVISYITAQNVYVKFQSTAKIAVGDTLFVIKDGISHPVLLVKERSSISCLCIPVSKVQLLVSDAIWAIQRTLKSTTVGVVLPKPDPLLVDSATDTAKAKSKQEVALKQKISGRISLSSYSNFSNVSDFSQRMRYNFSLNASNIGGSKFSAETYISFVHKMNEWSDVKNDIFNGLKIYSLSLNYCFNNKSVISFGRKFNTRLSNVGAIDGLQYDLKHKSFTAGIIAGTRPDYLNYSFNRKLLQFGAYVGHDLSTKNGIMQSSLAVVEQRNSGYVDRRFTYFQHSNSLLPNLYFFGSVEFNLYNKKRSGQDTTLLQDNSPKLSNLYVSLRYKVIKQLSLTLSYSERQNIIYYETYKSIIEQLLESATQKGFVFQANYNPGKNISIGSTLGYRYSKSDPKPSKNVYSYLTYSNVPILKASATVSATLLQTAFLSGGIYSIGISRDLFSGKLYGGLGYRYVNYTFASAETKLIQNMAELNLTWRMMKKLSCSLNYEGTFEKGKNYDRIYFNLTQRF